MNKEMSKSNKNTDDTIEISEQTLDIYNNLLKYYNGCSNTKCQVESSKIESRIIRFYTTIKEDEKLTNYLLKRNKLLFYKNRDTEILPKINLYAYLKEEDRDEVLEKIWDNITLIYLSIEESLEKKDEQLYGNLTKSLEGGSLGKLFDNLHEEIDGMDVNGMFEKLKANSTPEAKSKASDLITDMISKLTDNMAVISKSKDPTEALMKNLQGLAQDYSKLFESGQMDFGSFLSAVPEILSNPEEITKNIDTSKLEGLDLPDLSNILDTSNVNVDGGNGILSGITEGLGGKLGESLNKMMGGKLDDVVATLIEKKGADMLEQMSKAEDDKNKVKPLDKDQFDELEEFLKDQKLS
jgi:hypothetical protein